VIEEGRDVMWGLAYHLRNKKVEPERGNGVRAPAIEQSPSACPTPVNAM
jgi:hypothetical protein